MQRKGDGRAWFMWVLGAFVALASPLLAAPAPASAGCVVTFRHGGSVQADGCEDLGEAVAYLRFGGWVVVLKSALVSVEDETGIKRFNERWTPEEARAQVQALPREGGVPVGPTGPEAAAAPAAQPPQVVYVPVPSPMPSQVIYQMPPPTAYYPPFFAFCRHCVNPRVPPGTPPFVRVVPTSPSDIGPQAIQKTFPSISPIRSR